MLKTIFLYGNPLDYMYSSHGEFICNVIFTGTIRFKGFEYRITWLNKKRFL